MRKCGECQQLQQRPLPRASAACVLAFSRTSMEEILERVQSMAAQKSLHMASAYCKACRRCTWMCAEGLDPCAASIDFLCKWNSSEHILASLKLCEKHLGKRKRQQVPEPA